jgi:hypothetical protein
MAKTYSDIIKEREAILGTFEALFKVRGQGASKGYPRGPRDPQMSEHIEFIENYEEKLKGLESYLKRLLDVPLEEKK